MYRSGKFGLWSFHFEAERFLDPLRKLRVSFSLLNDRAH
jgi:hypothetical protein